MEQLLIGLTGAPNDSFLSDPLKRYFRLHVVPLIKLCRFISCRAIIFLSCGTGYGIDLLRFICNVDILPTEVLAELDDCAVMATSLELVLGGKGTALAKSGDDNCTCLETAKQDMQMDAYFRTL